MTISSQENHHFSLCSYFHAHPTTLLLKILGETNAWAVPHLKFWGAVPPFPLGLRSCLGIVTSIDLHNNKSTASGLVGVIGPTIDFLQLPLELRLFLSFPLLLWYIDVSAMQYYTSSPSHVLSCFIIILQRSSPSQL